MQHIHNPVECPQCNRTFPDNLMKDYVVEKEDRKAIMHQTVHICVLCVADNAGRRMGLTEPYAFPGNTEMGIKQNIAQNMYPEKGYAKFAKVPVENPELEEVEELVEADPEEVEEVEEAELELETDEDDEEDDSVNMLSDEDSENVVEPPKRRGRPKKSDGKD